MAQASAEKLQQTVGLPAETESVVSASQSEQLANTPEPSLPKGKRNRAICPHHQIVRWEKVEVSESRTLARKRRVRAGACREKSQLNSEGRQILRSRGREGKENLPRSNMKKYKQVHVSGSKSSPEGFGELCFYSTSGQKWNNRIIRPKGRVVSIKRTADGRR